MNEPDLSVRLTKEFRASKELMFAVETESSHVRQTIAPYGERVDVCEIDLRVGGLYHFVFTPEGGEPCSFRGEFVVVDPPNEVVATWIFDGWPGVTAVESKRFVESNGVTTLHYELTFPDAASRARMRGDGLEANYLNLERYVASLTAN